MLHAACCMRPSSGADAEARAQCGHVFHLLCLRAWLDSSPTCPNCRRPIDAPAADDAGGAGSAGGAELPGPPGSGEGSPAAAAASLEPFAPEIAGGGFPPHAFPPSPLVAPALQSLSLSEIRNGRGS